ncbi:substrate-binding periplasmic protein [Rhodovibrionaceae bacterium A322]
MSPGRLVAKALVFRSPPLKAKLSGGRGIIATLVLAASLIGLLAPAQADSLPETLVIGKGSQDYPPYHWTEGEEVVGFVPDLIRATAKSLGITRVVFKAYPWKRMLNQAEIGALDAVMPLFKTPERTTFLDYPNEPLTNETVAFFTSREQPVDYTGQVETMLPYSIGSIAGYSYGATFDNLPFTRIEVTNETTLIKMIKAKRFRVGISDVQVLQHYAKNLDFQPNILAPPVAVEPLFIGFSKKRNLGSFVTLFSEELARFKNTNDHKLILTKYGLTTASY